jgi:hypothetical protein
MFDQKTMAGFAEAYRQIVEGKKCKREAWVPESIQDEDVADFMGAASAAAKAGKKDFEFGGKKYKVTMKKDTADKISEADIETCEKCGKVHEGPCSKDEVKSDDEEEVKESPEEPRAQGEKDFKDKHDVEVKDTPDEYKAKK